MVRWLFAGRLAMFPVSCDLVPEERGQRKKQAWAGASPITEVMPQQQELAEATHRRPSVLCTRRTGLRGMGDGCVQGCRVRPLQPVRQFASQQEEAPHQ